MKIYYFTYSFVCKTIFSIVTFFFSSISREDNEEESADNEAVKDAQGDVEIQEGDNSSDELVINTEVTSDNEDIVDESVFHEMWGKLKIGKDLER